MKCPYVVNEVENEISGEPRYFECFPKSEEIRPEMLYCNDTSKSKFRIMTECIGNECGAWHRGRCRRIS